MRASERCWIVKRLRTCDLVSSFKSTTTGACISLQAARKRARWPPGIAPMRMPRCWTGQDWRARSILWLRTMSGRRSEKALRAACGGRSEPDGQAIYASPDPPSHRMSVIRRERRPPDQILAAERACEAFTEDLSHAVRREVIGHFRPHAITRRRRSAGQIDVMTADIPARGIGKQRGRAIGVGHALPARLGVIGDTGEAPLRRSAEWLMELSDQTTSSNP